MSDERVVSGMLVPWDVPTRVARPIDGWEMFRRGALDETLSDTSRRVPLILGHPRASDSERVAGYLIDHQSRRDGHWGTFKIFRSSVGDDAWEMIRERVVMGLSVGGWADPAATTTRIEPGTRRKVTERSRMLIDHIALVRRPAYEQARVLVPGEERHLQVVRESPAVVRARARMRIHARQRERWQHMAG